MVSVGSKGVWTVGGGNGDTPWFEIDQKRPVARVRLGGEIDLAVKDQLRRVLADATADRPGALHLDLRAVTFLDSSGLHELLAARDLAGELVLVAPSDAVRRVFELSAVDPLFRIVDDET